MKNWFDTWFDTKYYHLLYQNRDYTEAELFISNLTNTLKIDKSAQVLDLACGKGRHSIFLNKLGYKVTGADLSKESIDHANQFSNDNLQFFEHDMRERIENKTFNYVFNLFTSIGYFENPLDNLKMLQSIDSYTTNDGVLVIDFMNAHHVIKNLVTSETKVAEGITFNITRNVVDGFIVKTIQFSDQGQNFEYHEKVQGLVLSDFEKYLAQTNFSIFKVAGDYNLGNFDLENSNRLIIFAKK